MSHADFPNHSLSLRLTGSYAAHLRIIYYPHPPEKQGRW